MSKTALFLIVITAILYSEPLTLSQCLDIALKKSPDIVALQNDVESSKAKVREVKSAFFPRVSASFSANRQVTPTSSTFGAAAALMGLGAELDNTSYSLGLNASQNIWDFGRSVALERQVSLSEELAVLQLEKKKKEVAYNVKKGFYSLLQAKGMEKVSRLTVNDMKHLLESVKARKEQGLATQIDVMNAEVEALKFELEAKKAVNQVELAGVSLKNMLVKSEEEELALAEEKLELPGETPFGLKSYEEAKSKSLVQRIDFKELKARGKIAEASTGGAYAEFWPSVSGQAGYQYTGTDLSLKDKSWNAGLNVSIPLFSGFARPAKVDQAELAFKNVVSAEKLLEQSIILQVKNNYFKITETKQDYELAVTKLEYLKKNLEAVNAKYEQGLSTLTDLIEAQTKKSSAELENLQALYAYHTALNELEYSMGGK
ncbi:MAG: TolC family protein [Candidatus Firestonebacteria bacterium]